MEFQDELTAIDESDPNGIDQHAKGAKLDSGKPRVFGFMREFRAALTAVAKVSTEGAKKYSPGGWQYVPNGFDRYLDAACRHRLKERHEDIDADFGVLHAAHRTWNYLAALELLLRDGAPHKDGIFSRITDRDRRSEILKGVTGYKVSQELYSKMEKNVCYSLLMDFSKAILAITQYFDTIATEIPAFGVFGLQFADEIMVSSSFEFCRDYGNVELLTRAALASLASLDITILISNSMQGEE